MATHISIQFRDSMKRWPRGLNETPVRCCGSTSLRHGPIPSPSCASGYGRHQPNGRPLKTTGRKPGRASGEGRGMGGACLTGMTLGNRIPEVGNRASRQLKRIFGPGRDDSCMVDADDRTQVTPVTPSPRLRQPTVSLEHWNPVE